jgi:hypothetical protein
VNRFCLDAQVRIYQDNRLLHSKTFRRLRPNQSYRLSSRWLSQLDQSGGSVHLVLQ